MRHMPVMASTHAQLLQKVLACFQDEQLIELEVNPSLGIDLGSETCR